MKLSKLIASAALCLVTLTGFASESEWKYKMERNPIDNFYIKDIKTGNRVGLLNGTFPNEKRYATMSVKIKSLGYFNEGNRGHMVLMVGMKEWQSVIHSGNGIIIGNSSEYLRHSGVCKGNKRVNAIAVETFFPYGNCVYGDDNGLSMRDGVEYDITITVDNTLKTVKTTVVDEYGDISESTVYTTFSDVALRGKHWAIKELMSKHSWTMYMSEPHVVSHW